MNTELLEKMRYLHSCGFDCDHSFMGKSENDWQIFKKLSREEYDLEESPVQPWFSESRLWSLLGKNRRHYVVYQDQDLLEELLDSVIHDIKEGYLEAKVKG